MKKFKRKYLIILLIITTSVLLYTNYKKDLYRWSCESENVGPSCLILGRLLEEEKSYSEALIYFKKSCERKYLAGCKELEKIYFKIKDVVKLKDIQKKICILEKKIKC
jgi:FOG: TPR repeat, SEL1 subfamily